MQRLLARIKECMRWVVKNPILLILVVLLVLYNKFAGGGMHGIEGLDLTRGDAILAFLEGTISSFLHPLGILLVLLGFLAAAALSLFNIGVNFGVFAGRPRTFLQGIRKLFSRSTLELFLVQLTVSAVGVFLGLMFMSYVIRDLGLAGLAGALIFFLALIIIYPVWFMAMATISTILAAEVSLYGKWHLLLTALRWPNLSRLLLFYMTRIGFEMLILSIAVLLVSYLHIPVFYGTLIIVLIITVPFALVRTGGFMLKFSIFKEDVWFRSYFKKYYERKQEKELIESA